MYLILRLSVITAIFVLTTFGLFADFPDVKLKTEIDTNDVLIGDWIRYGITITVPFNTIVTFPEIKDSIGKIEFLGEPKLDTLSQGNELKLKNTYVVTVFEPGVFIMPSLPVLAQVQGTDRTDTFYTETISLIYQTLDVDTTLAIKDIKPILDEPISWLEYLWLIIIIVVAIGLAFAGYYLYKKYRKPKVEVLNYDPSIPPYEFALQSLKELDAEKLWQKGQVKFYYTRLTDIVRIYIERQFEFFAMEMITSEIIDEIKNKDVLEQSIESLKELLNLADLVKFAKYNPLPDENGSVMQKAFSFVESTRAYKPEETKSETNEVNKNE